MSELKNIAPIQSRTDLQKSMPSLPSVSAAKERQASQVARKILASYPDYGKAPPEYLLAVTEFLAHQSDDDQAALAHPVSGVAARCQFLPTIADMRQFVDERHKRINTRATGYRYLTPGEEDEIDIPPAERRKAQVLAELGYDPLKPRDERRRPIEPAILDAIEEGSWSSDHLKTPSQPASAELKALLIEQGYLLPAKTERAA